MATFDDIKREHVEKALDFILEYGEEKNGVWVIGQQINEVLKYDQGKFAGKVFGIRMVFRAAFLYCIDVNMKPPEILKILKNLNDFRTIRMINEPNKEARLGIIQSVWKKLDIYKDGYLKFDKVPKTSVVPNGKKKPVATDNESGDKTYKLIKQFYQIIFYGPPGTGKTRRAIKMLPRLLNLDEKKVKEEQGERWDIVQFHPSYNYEDFVRGVKVTTKDGSVAYTTEDRIFGKICQRAQNNSNSKKYVLIIDEINRANVSAVLGELIYALEYRGEKIKTPYAVDDENGKKVDKKDMLVIPKNLYIIGTMNTADRTIGQIDYAVRRRFAFEHCKPNKGVIEGGDMKRFFERVDGIFDNPDYISPDYDADDVRIGHSYFLHDAERKDISRDMQIMQKIIYQVVPILREYVKDGVLLSEAKDEIDKIEKKAKELSSSKMKSESDEPADEEQNETLKTAPFYYWEKEERFGINLLGRTVLSIVKDYVKTEEPTVDQLQAWFPDNGKNSGTRGIKLKDKIKEKHWQRFFMGEGEGLIVEGKVVYVTKEWGNTGTDTRISFEGFRKDVNKKDEYIVRDCYPIRVDAEVTKGISEMSFSNPDEFGKIKIDDIVFAFLSRSLSSDLPSEEGKYVGMGRVRDRNVDESGQVMFRINWEKTFSVGGKWGAQKQNLQRSLENIEKKIKGE